MDKKGLHIDPEVLIARYLNREATDEEVMRLEHWVKEDPEHWKLFLQYKKAYHLAGQKGKKIDTDRAWNKISGELSEEKIAIPKVIGIRRNRNRIWQIAAVIALMIGASFWLYYNTLNSGTIHFGTEAVVMTDELPDGSIISLNRHSKISYEQKEERNVSLTGDAFFDVKRDESKPFVVQADSLKVRVLGTSFYINAREDNPVVEVIVRSGRVVVSYEADSLVLGAGESAIFHKENKSLRQSVNEDVNYLSWKTKTLVFDDMNLSSVISKINEVYDAGIVLNTKELENCKITVTFKQQELESILTIIAETLDLTIDRKAGEILLDGTPCH